MDAAKLLAQMGWPADRIGETGLAHWSGLSADRSSTLEASISRGRRKIIAEVLHVSERGPESLLRLEATVDGARAQIVASHAGEPPQPIPPEDASSAFRAMSSRLGSPSLTCMAPAEPAPPAMDAPESEPRSSRPLPIALCLQAAAEP